MKRDAGIISTGIAGLDQALDSLRPGDTVTWQIENIGAYMYVATQFVVDEALTGRPMVYLRFGDHDELIPTEVLRSRGTNIKKITLDPAVGFETFAVQVHRIISSEPPDSFFLFDCLSELQRYWFSDLMIGNFFCLTSEFIASRCALCYVALRYERHIYEMISEGRVDPKLVIGVPVGFVNVVQSKELIMTADVPYIVARGRKGGSNVAAAICNALLYMLGR